MAVMDKLSAMQTFVQVIEADGFGRAADRMQIPKARVTQRIQALERALGVRLIHRTTRTMQVTQDGRAYYEKCVQLLANIEELEDAMRRKEVSPIGTIRVDAIASIARQIIAPALTGFMREYPGIDVRLGCTDRIVDLLEEGVDCAIRGGELPDSSLVIRKLFEVRMGLYASPSYLATHPALGHPSELRDHVCLGSFSSKTGQSMRWKLTNNDVTIEFLPGAKFEFDDGDAAVSACLAGGGIMIAPQFSVATYIHTRALTQVLPEWSAGVRPVYIVYPSRRHLSARVRCFVDWVIKLMATDQALSAVPGYLPVSPSEYNS
ncbi:MAG: hypothetical protein RL230_2278 [Pseudomonadota bacterium]